MCIKNMKQHEVHSILNHHHWIRECLKHSRKLLQKWLGTIFSVKSVFISSAPAQVVKGFHSSYLYFRLNVLTVSRRKQKSSGGFCSKQIFYNLSVDRNDLSFSHWDTPVTLRPTVFTSSGRALHIPYSCQLFVSLLSVTHQCFV